MIKTKQKRAQSAAEFVILITAVLFFFLTLTYIIQQNISQKANEKRNIDVEELALTAQNELNIAARATDGYRREFDLPNKILNINYNITLVNNNSIYIITQDSKHAISLPGQKAVGDFIKGTNVIKKINSTIYLNSNPQ